MKTIKGVLTLVKIRVVGLSTLSAATGYFLAGGDDLAGLPLFALALFLTAAGSAAGNQYQERELDRLMARTQNRPLADGTFSPALGLAIALVSVAAGLLSLLFFFGTLPAVLGLSTVLLYNGLYTYLKMKTAFAAVPGALVGALPPVIGWTAAGGDILSPAVAALAVFFYLWQVPHFWLLSAVHSREYRQAGFPGPGDVFSIEQVARIVFTWIAAAACVVLILPLFGLLRHPLSLALGAVLSLLLAGEALALLKKTKLSTALVYGRVFKHINLFALLTMVILVLDHGVFYKP